MPAEGMNCLLLLMCPKKPKRIPRARAASGRDMAVNNGDVLTTRTSES